MLTQTKQLPTPKELHAQLPLTQRSRNFIENSRQAIRAILDGKDSRLLLIMGPCSIHDTTAAKQYAMHLKQLAAEVEESFFIVMRVYCEKARTILGWKGLMYDPDLDGSDNLPKGIETTRRLLSELADMEVPVAAELLDTASPAYYGDLLSWGCIGARTVSSQIHRQMASALDLPVGFKNSTDGNISVAVHGVSAAASPHIFPGIDCEGRIAAIHAAGNPYAHVVLRGSESKPNYDSQSITLAQRMLREAELPEYLIVDCSHGNCVGLHEHQRVAFRSAIAQRATGNRAIRGIIMESNLSEGRQNLHENRLKFGVSITDPCLGWEDTEQLVLWGRDRLESIEETPSEKTESLCSLE